MGKQGMKRKKRKKKTERKKRMEMAKRIALLAAVCIFALCLVPGSGSGEGKSAGEAMVNLEGQWKVTDYLASRDVTVEYDFYEHFLGRSIYIRPNRIIKSFGLWADLREDVVSQYRTVETETVNGGTYGRKLGKEWQKKYGDQDVTVITYDMPESREWNASSTFVVTEEGEVLCWYLGNIYYMERYREAVTDMEEKELYGEWKVRRLVSFQDGWKGRNDQFYAAEYREYLKYGEEDGGYFYPESYLGNTVIIGEDGMEIYGGSGVLPDRLETGGYTSAIVDKYGYQNEKGIHDELGLTNEEIQVFTGNIREPGNSILDGEIVAVSRTEVIIKIYQGWYLLEKT